MASLCSQAHLCVSRSRGSALDHVTVLLCLGGHVMAARMSKASALAPWVSQNTPAPVGGEPSPKIPGQHF